MSETPARCPKCFRTYVGEDLRTRLATVEAENERLRDPWRILDDERIKSAIATERQARERAEARVKELERENEKFRRAATFSLDHPEDCLRIALDAGPAATRMLKECAEDTRRKVMEVRSDMAVVVGERDTARAQLAEAVGLLRTIVKAWTEEEYLGYLLRKVGPVQDLLFRVAPQTKCKYDSDNSGCSHSDCAPQTKAPARGEESK